MNHNICHFIPYKKDYHSLHTINFVLETKPQIYSSLNSESVYKMHYVCSGTGILHTAGKSTPLTSGDIFFTFPGTPHCIESIDSFTYMYISFLGARGNMMIEKLTVSSQNFHFSNCNEMYDFWQKGLNTLPEISDWIAESVLLYSFHFLGNTHLSSGKKKTAKENVALIIKKYIDDNFSQQKLSLNAISTELSYSPKYISTIFKKTFNIGIAEYLNTLRIQNACTLISQGFTSVSHIASQCGYADPQYFSKVFKQKMGVSPQKYICNNQL